MVIIIIRLSYYKDYRFCAKDTAWVPVLAGVDWQPIGNKHPCRIQSTLEPKHLKQSIDHIKKHASISQIKIINKPNSYRKVDVIIDIRKQSGWTTSLFVH